MTLHTLNSFRAAVAATALAASAALAGHAAAADVTWDLKNVAFEDGATASGSFVYDVDTHTYVSWDIVTTPTVDISAIGFTYLNGATYTTDTDNIANTSNNISNTRGVEFVNGTGFARDSFGPLFASALTDAGGTILLGGKSGFGSEVEGFNSRSIVSGEIVSVSAAPEPAIWALMIVGLGGGGLALRMGRRRNAGVAVA